jgi:hypothetical protein
MIAVRFDDERFACDRAISSTGCGDWWQTSDEIELVEEGASA